MTLEVVVGMTIVTGVLVAALLMFAAIRQRLTMPERSLKIIQGLASILAAWMVPGIVSNLGFETDTATMVVLVIWMAIALYAMQRALAPIVLDNGWPCGDKLSRFRLSRPSLLGRRRPTFQYAADVNIADLLED